MAVTKGRQLNPLFEEIRENIPKPPDVTKIIKDLVTIPKIHAAYLFYTQEGRLLLQKLCLLLSGTKPSYRYANWENFGIQLELEPILITSLKYTLQNEDPTSYVLLAYVQKDDATIEQILYALYEIKRYDVVLEIRGLVEKTCNEILIKYNTDNETDIIKPPVAPNCPFILKNFDKIQKNHRKLKIVPESLQKSSSFIPVSKPTEQNYAKTILLTYTSDADNIVTELLSHLRKPRNNLKLGVVVLNEQYQRLNMDPEEFIYECFAQVDYVFPIITEKYIKQITNKAVDINFSALENPDHKYVKYIYRLMNIHYLRNRCKNTMVRCLMPQETTEKLLKHPIMGHPLFQIWVRTNEVDELVNAILKIKM